MKSSNLFHRSPRTTLVAALGMAALGIAALVSVGCPRAQEPSVTDEASGSIEAAPSAAAEAAALAELEAEAMALRERQEAAAAEAAAIEAAGKALAEREAALQLREEQLRKEEALRQERARVAQRKAEAEARERRLAAKEKELENYEANLAFQEKELRDREAALEESTAVANDPVEPEILDEADPIQSIATASSEAQPESDRPETVYASLEPGRLLEIEFKETVSSATHRQGDTFSARLVQDLTAEDGTLVVAAGTEVIGRVTRVTPLKRVGGRASIEIEFTHLVLSPTDTVAISASFVELGVDKRKDKKKIAGAAIVGAILGRILGGDGAEGILAGAAAGAAAGTIAVTRGEGKDAEIPRGQIVALQLEEVVTVEIRMTGPVDR
ncbi:MAG: hypothetical protein IH936_12455 [Acidobacteria bacterium]|nr:hypothetical protein [Acidobacteriota bacterium]